MYGTRGAHIAVRVRRGFMKKSFEEERSKDSPFVFDVAVEMSVT